MVWSDFKFWVNIGSVGISGINPHFQGTNELTVWMALCHTFGEMLSSANIIWYAHTHASSDLGPLLPTEIS